MDNKQLKELLISHEGLKLKPYVDTVGKLSIGVGRNLDDNGITKEEAMFLLENDIKNAKKDLKKIFDDFDILPWKIQMVLIDMMFNLGFNRFRKFKKMIAAVKEKNWENMIREMKDSKWCRQLPNRCNDNARLIKEWIEEESGLI